MHRQLGQPGGRAAGERGVQELPGRVAGAGRPAADRAVAAARTARAPARAAPTAPRSGSGASPRRCGRAARRARRRAWRCRRAARRPADRSRPNSSQKRSQWRVGGDADEDLLAVGGGEELVHAPAHARALADLRHRHRRLAGGRVLGQPLARPRRRTVSKRPEVIFWPAAGLRPLVERGEDRDHPVGGGAHVHDRGARAQGLAARPGHEGEPGRHLRELVEEGARLRRAGEEALEREVDDARDAPEPARRSPGRGPPPRRRRSCR